MSDWMPEIEKIAAPDTSWRARARSRLREQTRPEGSLGLLEGFIERLVAIQKREKPDAARKRILIFAGDHGVVEEGVSLYPREVTRAMVMNFLNGGATINALARHLGAEVRVIDSGVDADFSSELPLVHAKAGRGTRNITRESAMTGAEFHRAFGAGWDQACRAADDGVRLLAVGEMGIGNTTAASAVIAALTDWPAEWVTGRGTGLDEAGMARKTETIRKALDLHKGHLEDPFSILTRLGGFEIAAMTGAILAAARNSVAVVVDGWICSAAALAAFKLNPLVRDYLFFAHQSEEKGHELLLESLEVKPILNLSLRLGEASGAALAMNILEAAMKVYCEVATFSEAGVAGRG